MPHFSHAAGSAQTAGDNQECRVYHLMNVKLSGDPALHCGHAGKSGNGVCVDAFSAGESLRAGFFSAMVATTAVLLA
jgi:hypothetical protein